jgi:hypothetical protein
VIGLLTQHMSTLHDACLHTCGREWMTTRPGVSETVICLQCDPLRPPGSTNWDPFQTEICTHVQAIVTSGAFIRG